jgi:hypothetical protein
VAQDDRLGKSDSIRFFEKAGGAPPASASLFESARHLNERAQCSIGLMQRWFLRMICGVRSTLTRAACLAQDEERKTCRPTSPTQKCGRGGYGKQIVIRPPSIRMRNLKYEELRERAGPSQGPRALHIS